MKVLWKRGALLILTLGVLFVSRWQLVENREVKGALHHRDAPNSLFSVLIFGGFRPLFLEYLWGRADALAAEGRWWEVSDVFNRIARLDPKNPSVWFNQAYTLAYSVAQYETDDRERWRLYRRALDHVERGLEENPDNWYLMELRFNLFFEHIAPDPFLSRHARMNLGVDGLEGALRAAVAMRLTHPDYEASWDHERAAGEESAEWLMNRGRLKDAADILDILGRHGERALEQFPKAEDLPRSLAAWRVWSELLRRGAVAADWAALGQGIPPKPEAESKGLAMMEETASLFQTPGALRFDPELEFFDAAAYSLIQFKGMELAQAHLLAKMPDAALRLSAAVAKLARLPGGEIGPRMPYYSEAYVVAFQLLVDADQALRRSSSDSDSEPSVTRTEARARFLAALTSIASRLKERAARSDGFAERLRKQRLDG